MTVGFLIDADCAIYLMKGSFPALRARVERCEPGEIAISAISFAEIMLGSTLDKPPPPEVIEEFLTQMPMLHFDEAAARAYATLPFKRARFDRLLAAQALSLGATVITHNRRDFDDVPGLVVEDWTE